VLALADRSDETVYISGDTVWYEEVAEVAERFRPRVVFLFMGAARVPEVGPDHLTFTAEEGIMLARAMPEAVIVPLHYEGWEHFSEGRGAIEETFKAARIASRLCWLRRGQVETLATFRA
jgi:L-ascorbate metabolism protein UlaG (beta-lactamase superfamily)